MCINQPRHLQQDSVPSSLVLEGLVLSSLTCTCRDPPLACSPGERHKKKNRVNNMDEVTRKTWMKMDYTCSPSAPLGFCPQYQYRLHPPSSRFLHPSHVPEREPQSTAGYWHTSLQAAHIQQRREHTTQGKHVFENPNNTRKNV